jgi:hypothetical protein
VLHENVINKIKMIVPPDIILRFLPEFMLLPFNKHHKEERVILQGIRRLSPTFSCSGFRDSFVIISEYNYNVTILVSQDVY